MADNAFQDGILRYTEKELDEALKSLKQELNYSNAKIKKAEGSKTKQTQSESTNLEFDAKWLETLLQRQNNILTAKQEQGIRKSLETHIAGARRANSSNLAEQEAAYARALSLLKDNVQITSELQSGLDTSRAYTSRKQEYEARKKELENQKKLLKKYKAESAKVFASAKGGIKATETKEKSIASVNLEAYERDFSIQNSELRKQLVDGINNLVKERIGSFQKRSEGLKGNVPASFTRNKKIASLDTETLSDNLTALTLGISEVGSKDSTDYLLLEDSFKKSTDQFVEMLTDMKSYLVAAQGIAQKFGLKVENRRGKRVVLGSGNKVLSATEIRTQVEKTLQKVYDAVDADTGVSITGKGKDTLYAVMKSKTDQLLSQYDAFVMAHADFDKKTLGKVNGKNEQLFKDKKVYDIFDFVPKDIFLRKGWNVDNLAKIFLSGYKGEKHIAGEDAYDEAQLYALIGSDVAGFQEAIRAAQNEIDKIWDLRTGGASKTDTEGNYTQSYRMFNQKMVTELANKANKQFAPEHYTNPNLAQEYQARTKKGQAWKDSVLSNLKGKQDLVDFLTGKTSREQIAKVTNGATTNVNYDSILNMGANFIEEMAQHGMGVKTEVVNDNGAYKLRFYVGRQSEIDAAAAAGEEALADYWENSTSPFDILLADKNFQIGGEDDNGYRAELVMDYWTGGVVDNLTLAANAMFRKASQLANSENGAFMDQNGHALATNIIGDVIRRWGNNFNQLSTSNSMLGHDMSELGIERQSKTINWKDWISKSVKYNENLSETLNNMGEKDPYNLREGTKAIFMNVMHRLANSDDESVKQYALNLRKTVESAGGSVVNNLEYNLLTNEKLEGFRRSFRAALKNAGGFNFTGLSETSVWDGKALIDKIYADELQRFIGQPYTESAFKTLQTGKNRHAIQDKNLFKDAAKAAGIDINETLIGKEGTTSDSLQATILNLPKEVLELLLAVDHEGIAQEHLLMAGDMADLLKGEGAQRSLKYKSQNDITNVLNTLKLSKEQRNTILNGSGYKFKKDVKVESDWVIGNTIIPKDSFITGIEMDKDTGELVLLYRQSGDIKTGTKFAMEQIRGQAKVKEQRTDYLRSKIISAINSVGASKGWAPEYIKSLEEAVSTSSVFRVEDDKTLGDPRKLLQYVAPVYNRIVGGDKNNFDKLKNSQLSKIINTFFKQENDGRIYANDIDWDAIDVKGLGFNSKDDLFAYMNNIKDNGVNTSFLADAIRVLNPNASQDKINAELNTGWVQMVASGNVDFLGADTTGFQNESAEVRTIKSTILRTNERLNEVREQVIRTLQANKKTRDEAEAEFEKISLEYLQGLLIQDQNAIDRANSIMGATRANASAKDFRKESTRNKVNIINLNDLLSLSAESPANDISFTPEELSKSVLAKIYENKEIGKNGSLTKLSFEGINADLREQLKSHGFSEDLLARGLMVGLGSLKQNKDGSHTFQEEERSLFKLLNQIFTLNNGEIVNDENMAQTYNDSLVEMRKTLTREAYSSSNPYSAYLRTDLTASGDTYGWLSANTAKGLLKFQGGNDKKAIDSALKDIKNLIDEYNNNNKKSGGKGSNFNIKNVAATAEGIDEFYSLWIDDIAAQVDAIEKGTGQYAGLDETQKDEQLQIQADRFKTIVNRLPDLHSTSIVNNGFLVRKGASDGSQDNLLYFTKQMADEMGADWDGDIIRLSFMRATADESMKVLYDALIERAKRIRKYALDFKNEKKNKTPADTRTNYQKLLENAKVVTDKDMALMIESAQITEKTNVGLGNWNTERNRAGLEYYKQTQRAGRGYESWDLLSSLYSGMFTELSQQTSISSKQLAALILAGSSDLGFGTSTAADIYNAVSAKNPDLMKEYGWGNSQEEFVAAVKEMLSSAAFSDAFASALGNAQEQLKYMADGKEKDELKDTIARAREIGMEGSAEKFFELLKPLGTAFDFIGKNQNAIAEFQATRFSPVTGLISEEMKRMGIYPPNGGEVPGSVAGIGGLSAEYGNQVLRALDLIYNALTDIANGGGFGGKGKAIYPENRQWELEIQKAKNSALDSSVGTDVRLHTNDGKHYYEALSGDFVTSDDGKIQFTTASGLGSSLTNGINHSRRTQLKEYTDAIINGQAVTSVDPHALELWQAAGFKGGAPNTEFSLMASSIVGNMQHALHEGLINAVATKGDWNVGNDWKKLPELQNKLREYYNQLGLLFGGGTEGKSLAQEYIQSRGGLLNNLNAETEALKQAIGTDAEVLKSMKSEQELAATFTYTNDKGEKESFNVAGTLDTLYKDKNGAIRSLDLKNKIANGKVSDADLIEGFIQQALIEVNSQDENWLKKMFGNLTDIEIANIQQNTKGSATGFLKSYGGEAAIRRAGINIDGLDTFGILQALLNYNNGVLAGNYRTLDISNLGGWQDYQRTMMPFDQYVDNAKKLNEYEKRKAEVEEELNTNDQLTDEEKKKRQEYIDILDQVIEQYKKQLDVAAKDIENYSPEQQAEIKKLEIENSKPKNGAKDANKAAKASQKGWMNYGQERAGLMGNLAYRLTNFIEFGAVQQAMGKLRQTFQKLLGTTQELDKAIVNIQIATGYQRDQVKELMFEYNNLAKEIGRTTTSIAEAANDWLRAGYKGKEASELVKASMYLSTLGMMDSSKATEALISVLKGWKISSNEVIEIVDKLVTETKNSVHSVTSVGHKFNCR